MTKDEKKIVGTLMELGVPPSQIKPAVGRHVTAKDLQNARTLLKTSKRALKDNESASTSKSSPGGIEELDKSVSKMLSASDDNSGGELIKEESEDGKILREVVTSVDNADSNAFIISVDGLQESLHDELVVEDGGGDRGDGAVLDAGGLSGLLAAAGISSDSVVVTMNSQAQMKEEEPSAAQNNSAYTVTLCLPDGDVSKKGNNLQELLKGLPLGKIVSKPSSNVTLPIKKKPPKELEAPAENFKLCIDCNGYISPLDAHDRCLSCLGPEHIQEETCQYCKAMTPEQFNIRRKKMVALRMKALKALQQKRKLEEQQQQERLSQTSDDIVDSDPNYGTNGQRSKRIRKPKSFGPDVLIENVGSKRKQRKMSNEDMNSNLKAVVKNEPFYEYEDSFLATESQIDSSTTDSSERFAHILSQTSVFDDVVCTELDNGLLTYTPDQEIAKDFHQLMQTPDLPAVPPSLIHKYKLDPRFEAEFCSSPESLRKPLNMIDPSTDVLNRGLCKLAVNAAANTRLAVYDKLFTRLGVGMADEALSILTELYGKVTQVTEISQEDLTSNLQTAVDTIQALKDVLEELGVMSKDAAQTAAYQRSISLQSLSSARSSLRAKISPRDASLSRRAKFTPFSTKKLSACTQLAESNSETTDIPQELTFTQEEMEVPPCAIVTSSVVPLTSSQTEASSTGEANEMPIITMAGPHSTIEVATEPETTFINMEHKIYSVAPMTISSELLQTLSAPKESIIENVGW